MTPFSKRHRRALAEGTIEVDLNPVTRGRISRLMRRFQESYTDSWGDYTDTTREMASQLLDLYGRNSLPHAPRGASLEHEGLIEKGPGEWVLDAMELFWGELAFC